MEFLIGIFTILHGLVHLLYFGQSRKLFKLRPDLNWPEGSWAFSKLLGDEKTRSIANISFILSAIVFVAGGIGMLIKHGWWPPIVIVSAAFSSVSIILFWDGKMKKLNDKGGIGLLINIAFLVAIIILQWPSS
jgi:hypothetical protein